MFRPIHHVHLPSSLCSVLIAVVLVGCAPTMVEPTLTAVSPSWIDNDSEHEITLYAVDLVPQIQVGGTDQMDVNRSVSVWLSERQTGERTDLSVRTISDQSVLQLLVPQGLVPGAYDITLESANGLTDTLSGAFEIRETAASSIVATPNSATHPLGATAHISLSVFNDEQQPINEDITLSVAVYSDDGELVFGDTLTDQQSMGPEGISGVLEYGDGYIEVSSAQAGRFDLAFGVLDPSGNFSTELQDGNLSLWFMEGTVEDITMTLDQEESVAGEPVGVHLQLLDVNNTPTTYPLPLSFLLRERCTNSRGGYQTIIQFPAMQDELVITATPQVVTGTEDCPDGGLEITTVGQNALDDISLSTSSSPLAITPSTPAMLIVETTFTPQVTAGTQPAQLVMRVEDQYGNVQTDYQQGLTFYTSQEGFVSSTCSDWLDGRILCTVDLLLADASTVVDVFSDDGLTSRSHPIEVLAGAVAELTLTTNGSVTTAGDYRQFSMSAADAYGNNITLAEDDVDFSLQGAPVDCTAQTAGTGLDVQCLLTVAGTDLRLTAETTNFQGDSTPFSVVSSDLAVVEIVAPSAVVAGEDFVVSLVGFDAHGNLFASPDKHSRRLEVQDSSGEVFETTSLSLTGETTSLSLRLQTAWEDNTLRVYQSGDLLGESSPFDVVPATATRLSITTAQTWNVVGTDPLEVVIAVWDAYGNLQTDFDGSTDGDGLLYSQAGLGPAVSLGSFEDGLLKTSFFADTPGISDQLHVTIGELSAISESLDFVDGDCAQTPTAVLSIDDTQSHAVLCLTDSVTDLVSMSAAQTTPASAPLLSYHFKADHQWHRTGDDALSVDWETPGHWLAEVVVVDGDACMSMASMDVYVADDDNRPAGPVDVVVVDEHRHASAPSGQGSTAVHIAATDCAGSAASGELILRTDVGVLSTGSVPLVSSGTGLEIELSSDGTADVVWDVGAQAHGNMYGQFLVGRENHAALGFGTVYIDNDAVRPIVTALSPHGTFEDATDTISVVFSEGIDGMALSTSSITVLDPDGDELDVLDVSVEDNTVTFFMADELDPYRGAWTIVLEDSIVDWTGNGLDGEYSKSTTPFEVTVGDVTDSAPDVTSCSGDLTDFRPDGDPGTGVEADAIEISFSAGGTPSWWHINVTDDSAQSVHHDVVAEGASSSNTWAWDGVNSAGLVVENGRYHITITALDAHWNNGQSCTWDVAVSNRLH